MRTKLVPAVLALLALAPITAAPARAAGADGFNAQLYRAPIDPHGYITLNGARTQKALSPFASANLHWAHNPLVLDTDGERVRLVENATMLDVAASIGLAEFGEGGGFALGVNIPLILDLHGVRAEDFDRRLTSGNIGDIRLASKITLSDREESLLGLYTQIFVDLPTGEEFNFTSNKDKVTIGAVVGVEKQVSIIRLGIEAGYEWIDGEVDFGDTQVDDKLLFKAGVGVELVKDLWLVAELSGFSRFEHLLEHERETPLELGMALHYSGEVAGSLDVYGLFGVSSGVTDGVGAPDARVFFSLGIGF